MNLRFAVSIVSGVAGDIFSVVNLPALTDLVPATLRLFTLLLLLALILSVAACQSTQYFWQAARGQWQLVADRTPLPTLINDQATPENTVAQLEYVQTVRTYAEYKLHLPVGDAYGSYVDLKRPYVVWNLFVTPELELKNQTWCYPVAGCVAYQGYFNENMAKEAAKEWENNDYDTHIGGVAAYSTLGWFADPVLNTFLFYDQISLSALLFHELAHRQLYVRNDTAFNESWATAVEEEAIGQYLLDATDFGRAGRNISPEQVRRYRLRRSEREQFLTLVKTAVKELEIIYTGNLPNSEKRQLKSAVFTRLKYRYREAVAQKRLSLRYQHWFEGPLNNAKLSVISNYHQWVPGLRYKIRDLKRNWKAFYQWSNNLADADKKNRDKSLRELNRQATLSGNSQ